MLIVLPSKIPFIIFTSSGGARMQEGIVSLMQMPRTVAAIELLNENNIEFHYTCLVSLGNPIRVTISFLFSISTDLLTASLE